MMKVCCLSDTHGMHREVKIPECDLILHAGDITNIGELGTLDDFDDWASSLNTKVICIAGNHDRSLQLDGTARSRLRHVTYLEDSSAFFECDGTRYKIYGSPWSPWFNGDYWAFNAHEREIEEMWNKIPLDTDILVTHGMPYGILDYVMEYGQLSSMGCLALLARIKELDSLTAYMGGHLHLCGGQTLYNEDLEVMFVNAAVCNEAYKPVNPVRTITIL